MKYLFNFITVILVSHSLLAQPSYSSNRIDLTNALGLDSNQFAQIYVPDSFTRQQEAFDLVFHLHGNSKYAEAQIDSAEADAILCNIYLGMLSSPYRNYFSDSTKFGKILSNVKDTLVSEEIIKNSNIKNLIITSFSAGYGGIREIIKYENYYELLDAITLADGLHSDLEDSIMNKQMKDFTRFAKDAADGEKIMILTHSRIEPETYASTTETADYLLNHLGLEREIVDVKDEIGNRYSEVHKENFHLYGYKGDTAEDHMKHLYHMDKMLKEVFSILRN